MTNKTKEFSLGKITYRMPNVVESMRLLSKLGVKSDGTTGDKSEFEMMADLIEHMGPYIVSIFAEKEGQTIETWEEALNHAEFIKPLSEIGAELISQFGDKNAEPSKRRKKS